MSSCNLGCLAPSLHCVQVVDPFVKFRHHKMQSSSSCYPYRFWIGNDSIYCYFQPSTCQSMSKRLKQVSLQQEFCLKEYLNSFLNQFWQKRLYQESLKLSINNSLSRNTSLMLNCSCFKPLLMLFDYRLEVYRCLQMFNLILGGEIRKP